ncbi:uncharacterized protein LOC111617839 isoform X1 [Centruroides sculpturatus]|uniref:uncharacterized protein LOC111617839 isoform X1 n=1 Tax=Centruroides sculpturatus TaxID=218467 RepID=UPI000C6EEA58|nr:uncharacterized protein LOC111617839 isoform X1 [Centruroides sculpturatus]
MASASNKKRLLEERARRRRAETERKEMLIEEIRCRPTIWNRHLTVHKDKAAVEEMWNEVASSVKLKKEVCKKLWKNLIDHFRNLYHQAIITKSDDDPSEEYCFQNIKWNFFHQMLFLKDMISRKDRSTNITVIPDIDIQQDSCTQEDNSKLSETNHLESPPSPASVCSTHKVNKSRKRSASNEETELNFLNGQIPVRDSCLKFGEYLMEILQQVPASLRRRCEMEILRVANIFADGFSPQIEIIIPTTTDIGISNEDL